MKFDHEPGWTKAKQWVPFDKHGNQLDYVYYYYGARDEIDWQENKPFEDTLVYDGYQRGRSAANMTFVRKSNGGTVTMFLTDFDHCIKHLVNGALTGTFIFCKRGANYGCKMVLPPESEC